jgi:hypothetical protein
MTDKHKSRNLRYGGYGGDTAPAYIWHQDALLRAHLKNDPGDIKEASNRVKSLTSSSSLKPE